MANITRPTIAWRGRRFVITSGTSWLCLTADTIKIPLARLRGSDELDEFATAVGACLRHASMHDVASFGSGKLTLMRDEGAVILYDGKTYLGLEETTLADLDKWLAYICNRQPPAHDDFARFSVWPSGDGVAIHYQEKANRQLELLVEFGKDASTALQHKLLAAVCDLVSVYPAPPKTVGGRKNGIAIWPQNDWSYCLQREDSDIKHTIGRSTLLRLALAIEAQLGR